MLVRMVIITMTSIFLAIWSIHSKRMSFFSKRGGVDPTSLTIPTIRQIAGYLLSSSIWACRPMWRPVHKASYRLLRVPKASCLVLVMIKLHQEKVWYYTTNELVEGGKEGGNDSGCSAMGIYIYVKFLCKVRRGEVQWSSFEIDASKHVEHVISTCRSSNLADTLLSKYCVCVNILRETIVQGSHYHWSNARYTRLVHVSIHGVQNFDWPQQLQRKERHGKDYDRWLLCSNVYFFAIDYA